MKKNNRFKNSILIIIGILIIVLIPAIINFIILQPSRFKFVGTSVDWLIFWGSYLGAIISAGVAFIILYIQRKDNEKANEANEKQNELNRINNEELNNLNRKLQIKVIEFQQKKEWLTELKSKCIDYYNAFDQNDIIDLCNLIIKNNEESLINAKTLLDSFIDRNNKVNFALEFLFTKEKDKEEIELLSKLNKYNLFYKALIYDVQFIISNVKLNDIINPNNLFNEIDSYKKLNKIPEITENRIYDLLSKYEIFYITDYYNFVVELFNIRRYFHSTLIQNTLTELVNHEETKINKIIDL